MVGDTRQWSQLRWDNKEEGKQFSSVVPPRRSQ